MSVFPLFIGHKETKDGLVLLESDQWKYLLLWAYSLKTIWAINKLKIPVSVEFTGMVGDRGKPEWKATLHSGFHMIKKVDQPYYGITIHEAIAKAGHAAWSILQAIKEGTYYE